MACVVLDLGFLCQGRSGALPLVGHRFLGLPTWVACVCRDLSPMVACGLTVFSGLSSLFRVSGLGSPLACSLHGSASLGRQFCLGPMRLWPCFAWGIFLACVGCIVLGAGPCVWAGTLSWLSPDVLPRSSLCGRPVCQLILGFACSCLLWAPSPVSVWCRLLVFDALHGMPPSGGFSLPLLWRCLLVLGFS